jgi:hypothetical protein
MVPALERIHGVIPLIDAEKYFVIHAPRQSGKTTFLSELIKKINSDGKYYALNCSLGTTKGIHNENTAFEYVAESLIDSAETSQIPAIQMLANRLMPLRERGNNIRIKIMLRCLCANLDKDLVVFFDEIDALEEPMIVTFLAQLRDGYLYRDWPNNQFPRSLALVGLRNIRDYRSKLSQNGQSGESGSPFNVKHQSLFLPDFSKVDIQNLYNQHTLASGQKFDDSAIDRAWHWTQGQPWLVNKLAYDIINFQLNNDFSKKISEFHFNEAAKNLIFQNEAHFESLEKRLKEPLVKNIMEAVITGADYLPFELLDEDVQLCLDLGLLKSVEVKIEEKHEDESKKMTSAFQPANPIYSEVIIKELTSNILAATPASYATRWMDGDRIDMSGLLEAFQNYWHRHSPVLTSQQSLNLIISQSISDIFSRIHLISSTESANEIAEVSARHLIGSITRLVNESYCLLVLLAFLQRTLNGGADFVDREVAAGRGRVDICVGYGQRRYLLELKIKGNMSLENSIGQILRYMNAFQESEGWLVIFDRNIPKSSEEILPATTHVIGDKIIHVITC